MSEKRKLLNTIITLLFFAAAIVFRMHLNQFSKSLTKYASPFISPLLTVIVFISFLAYLVVMNRSKIRNLDNLTTKDMIYVASLLIFFVTSILLAIYGLIKGTI